MADRDVVNRIKMMNRNEHLEFVKETFPKADDCTHWCRKDLIDNAEYMVARILFGATIVEKPKGYDKFVLMKLCGKEYLMLRDHYKLFQRLLEPALSYMNSVGWCVEYNQIDNVMEPSVEFIPDTLKVNPDLMLNTLAHIQNVSTSIIGIPEGKLKCMWIRSDNFACGYYRSTLPFRYMHDKGEQHAESTTFVNFGSISFYDVLFFGRVPGASTLHILQVLRSQRNRILVHDLDDDVFNVPEWSLASQLHDRITKERCKTALDLADYITVTCEQLKENLGYQKKTYVTPNLLDVEKYTWKNDHTKELDGSIRGYMVVKGKSGAPELQHTRNGKRKPVDKVRANYNPVVILWAGSQTHDEDLKQIVPVVQRLGEEYGIAIRFVFFGYCPLEFSEGLASAGNAAVSIEVKDKYSSYVTHVAAVEFGRYEQVLAEIKPDIAICPLVEHEFNLCKSNIKPLEMGCMKVPSIVTDYGPYSFIEDGVNGFKVKSSDTAGWINRIKQLIESKSIRRKMGEEIYNTVFSKYSWQTDNEGRRLWEKFFNDLETRKKSLKAESNVENQTADA